MTSRKDASAAINALFAPRHIAIFDASLGVSAFAQPVWRSLRRHGFSGEITVVGTSDETDLPFSVHERMPPAASPDVAIAALPHQDVKAAITACAGARALILVTPGYAEASTAGAARQDDLVACAREHRMRLLGPNCLGTINTTNGALLCRLPAADQALRQGRLSLFCQSGSMLSSLLAMGQRQGIGFRHLAATGNEADLALDDFIAYSLQDPETAAIGLVIESLRHPRRFLDLAQQALAQGLPIVALHVGRSQASQRLIQRHTAAIITPEAVMLSAFHKAGIIAVKTPEALLATAQVMATTATPKHVGLAIWGTSGGLCGMLADLAADAGLTMASLASNQAIQALGQREVTNPIDLGSLTHPDGYKPPDLITQVIEGLEQQEDLDLTLVGLGPGHGLDQKVDQLITNPGALSTVVYAPFGDGEAQSKARLQQAGWHPIDSAHAAITATKGLITYAKARRRSHGQTAPKIDIIAPSASINDHFAHSLAWMASQGLPTPAGAFVTSDKAAESAIQQLGIPLVLKLVARGLYHKAAQDGVYKATSHGGALQEYHRLRAQPGAEGVYLQRHVAGIELLWGSQIDPQLGLLLVLAPGGRWAEHRSGSQLLLPPLSEEQLQEALQSLLPAMGQSPSLAFSPQLSAVLMKLAAIAEVLAETGRVIECNPLMVSPEGVWLVDAWITSQQ